MYFIHPPFQPYHKQLIQSSIHHSFQLYFGLLSYFLRCFFDDCICLSFCNSICCSFGLKPIISYSFNHSIDHYFNQSFLQTNVHFALFFALSLVNCYFHDFLVKVYNVLWLVILVSLVSPWILPTSIVCNAILLF